MNKNYLHPSGRPLTKEEFVERIKVDDNFNDEFGDLGKIYGHQWRNWDDNIDQISDLIKQLKENPDSRRLLVSAWNCSDLDSMVLPPCHYSFQVYTRELSYEERAKLMDNIYGIKNPEDRVVPWHIKDIDDAKIPTRAISLMFNMRSTDVGLGLGFNLASYGLLLMMIAKQVNMIPEELIYNGGDVHLYSNHVEPIKEQLTREPFELPTLEILGEVDDIGHYEIDNFVLKNYQSHSTIKLPLSN